MVNFLPFHTLENLLNVTLLLTINKRLGAIISADILKIIGPILSNHEDLMGF